MLAIAGRRPFSASEVAANVTAITTLQSDDTPGARIAARRIVARTMMVEPSFRGRWSDFFKDALHVARTQAKSLESCYGETSEDDAGSVLADWVRSHDAAEAESPQPGFTMRELLASALELDDLSVVYRANLFAMLGRPMNGAASALELELARRNDFGAEFEATYTQRDVTCLGCHNSDYSVTRSSDPATNRFWPIGGGFERALFGSSTGTHPAAEAADHGSDVLRACGMFRVTDVLTSGNAPFGWSSLCGTFARPVSDDPLGVDTYFASVHSTSQAPAAGIRASVWDLERALHRGVDAITAQGLVRSADGSLDPDHAFAYLVALTIAEKVWTEVMGRPLTVAHHFPRTEAQRDELARLADGFVANHFSLQALLLDIVTDPTFNLKPPSSGCGSAYPLARLLDPWTDGEADVSARGNGPSDGVFALSPRLLVRAMNAALGWSSLPEYPSAGSTDEKRELGLGFFLRDAEPGRRGLDFQGRLTFEAAYAACAAPGSAGDFITALSARAAGTPGATLGDAVVALKDRILGQPSVGPGERSAIEALLDRTLDDTGSQDFEPALRQLCGALLATPWFQLGGLAPDDSSGEPLLTPPEASYASACGELDRRLRSIGSAAHLDCAR